MDKNRYRPSRRDNRQATTIAKARNAIAALNPRTSYEQQIVVLLVVLAKALEEITLAKFSSPQIVTKTPSIASSCRQRPAITSKGRWRTTNSDRPRAVVVHGRLIERPAAKSRFPRTSKKK